MTAVRNLFLLVGIFSLWLVATFWLSSGTPEKTIHNWIAETLFGFEDDINYRNGYAMLVIHVIAGFLAGAAAFALVQSPRPMLWVGVPAAAVVIVGIYTSLIHPLFGIEPWTYNLLGIVLSLVPGAAMIFGALLMKRFAVRPNRA